VKGVLLWPQDLHTRRLSVDTYRSMTGCGGEGRGGRIDTRTEEGTCKGGARAEGATLSWLPRSVQKKLSSYTTAQQASQYLMQRNEMTMYEGEVQPAQVVCLAQQALPLHYNPNLEK
jgi:hypothetical protein